MLRHDVGSSGLRVSSIGLGCNNFGGRLDQAETASIVHSALDHGITLFDTAPNYGEGRSEAMLGEALGARRKDIVLATKFGARSADAGRRYDNSRQNIMHSVERSLTALRTEWIDLYQMHWPDSATPIEESLRALDDLVRQGKVRYVGCSNMPAWQLVDAQWTARTQNLSAFISCQDEYSLLARTIERELIPAISACGLGLLAYSPLASGLLTGKYRSGGGGPTDGRLSAPGIFTDKFLNESNLARVSALSELADRYGLALLDVALRWLASRPAVSSILVAAMTPDQLAANVRAAAGELPGELLCELDHQR